MISKRLRVCAQYVKGFNRLADCGTDHAYLPIYAVLNHYVKSAIASDNKSQPLKNALENIREAKLEEVIDLKLADGLPYLTEDIDCVSILGMGGRLIRTILENADLTHVKRLVLSPNSEQEHLRSFLENNHWQIIDESFIKDRSKHYQMIVCEPGKMKLEDIEREFGPVIIRKKEPEFIEYLLNLIVKLENAKNNTNSAQESSRLDQRIQILKELIQ